MTYGASSSLQHAVFTRLSGDAAVASLVGAAIYDVVPKGTLPPSYITIGPEDVRDASDQSGPGAEHRFTVSVATSEAGFQTAKRVSEAITDALVDADLTLERGELVSLTFLRARAQRVRQNDMRRVDLTFRARVCLG